MCENRLLPCSSAAALLGFLPPWKSQRKNVNKLKYEIETLFRQQCSFVFKVEYFCCDTKFISTCLRLSTCLKFLCSLDWWNTANSFLLLSRQICEYLGYYVYLFLFQFRLINLTIKSVLYCSRPDILNF